MSRLMQALVGISVIAALPALARAQCPPLWAQETAAAFNGAIRDFTQWNGGLAAVGGFTQVNGQPAPGVAVWNGETWTPHGGAGFPGTHRSAVAFNNWLVVDGMVWIAPFWVPLANQLSFTTINAMAVYNGELYAAGTYNSNLNSCVWKFVNWSWVGVGLGNPVEFGPVVNDLQVYNGKLVACGNFWAPTQGSTPNIAQWNGTTWSSLGTPTFPTQPRTLGVAQGELFVSGYIGLNGYVMSYNGTAWRNEFTTANNEATAFAEYDDAVFVGVGGRFMVRRNGVWTSSPQYFTSPGIPTTYDFAVHHGTLFIGGSFNTLLGQPAANLARYTIRTSDYDGDGDFGADADIEAFFACLGGACCPTCAGPDLNGDGDVGTDADIESFFRLLGGGCA